MQTEAYLGLGSNIDDKALNLRQAIEEISKLEETEIISVSSLYITKAWGKTDQEDFLNQVICIKTGLSPQNLLKQLQNIEINMGRERTQKWGPRIIDIDILLYGDQVIHTEELIVPHPYMRQRLFVLVPLKEINEDVVFPDDGAHIQEVLSRVEDRERNNIIKRL